MKDLLIVLSLLMTTFHVTAQETVIFGEVAEADLKMTQYDLDTGASAVVLFDKFTIAKINKSKKQEELLYERHIRIKILNASAFELADIEIPIYDRYKATFSNLNAHTINWENGEKKISKVKNESVFDEKIREGVHVRKFTFPDLKEGSIIEYKYQYTDNFYYSFYYPFQKDIPARWTEIKIVLPTYLGYSYEFDDSYDMAINKVTTKELKIKRRKFDVNIYHFAMKDLPAIRDEPFVSNLEDYRKVLLMYISRNEKIGEEIISTWRKMTRSFLNYSKGAYTSRKRYKAAYKKCKQYIKGDFAKPEKMKLIYNFVANKVKWNNRYRVSLDYYTDLGNVYKWKKGNSAEINLMLLALLREADLNANPVLLSTRHNGKPSENIPFLFQFNHVIVRVKIGDEVYFLDAIDENLPFNFLNINDVVPKGWLIEYGVGKWVDIPKYRMETDITPKLALTEDGTINGSFNISLNGYAAKVLREKIEAREEGTDVEISAHEEEKEFDEEEISDYQVINLDDRDKPLILKFNIETTNFTETAGGLIYFSPVWLTQFKENPFIEETRNLPIDLAYQIQENYNLELEIPEGYSIDHLPESKSMEIPNGLGDFSFSVNKKGDNLIKITSKMNLHEPTMEKEQYQSLKQFFELIAEKHNEQIVLKKK